MCHWQRHLHHGLFLCHLLATELRTCTLPSASAIHSSATMKDFTAASPAQCTLTGQSSPKVHVIKIISSAADNDKRFVVDALPMELIGMNSYTMWWLHQKIASTTYFVPWIPLTLLNKQPIQVKWWQQMLQKHHGRELDQSVCARSIKHLPSTPDSTGIFCSSTF